MPDMEKQGYQLTGDRKCLFGKKDAAYLLSVKAEKQVYIMVE